MWELWSGGKVPYEGLTNSQTIDEIVSGHRLLRPEPCPVEVYSLMTRCWLSVSYFFLQYARVYTCTYMHTCENTQNIDDRPSFETLYKSLQHIAAVEGSKESDLHVAETGTTC